MRHKKQGLVIMLSTVATLLATTGRSAQAAPPPLCGSSPILVNCFYDNQDPATCYDYDGSGYALCDYMLYLVCGAGYYSEFFQCIDQIDAAETYGCPYFYEDGELTSGFWCEGAES